MRAVSREARRRTLLRTAGRAGATFGFVAALSATGMAVTVPNAAHAAHAANAANAEAPVPTVSPSPSAAFRVSDPRVAGVGGVVAGTAHPDVWWALGSGTGRPRLFALGRDGGVRAAYTLTGVPAGHRWNALTIVRNGSGAANLFLGDLTEGRLGSLSLYRVAEPAALRNGTLAARPFKLRYPDGGHDGGTLLADPREGRVYIVTRAATAAAVFALPGVLGPQVNELTRLRTLRFGVRGGGFAPDGRVVFRTSADLRVLAGIRDKVTQVVKLARASGDALGVAPDGRRALVADRGARPVFRAVALPAGAGGPTPAATKPLGSAEEPVSFPSKSGPPGGLLGTGALAGLLLLGVLGVAFYLRGRRRTR